MPATTRTVITAIAVSAALAACDADEADSTTTRPVTVAAPPVTTPDLPRPDGRLTIGLLLPTTGPGSALGQALADGANRAILEINATTGVRGEPVVVVGTDEGDTVDQANEAIRTLIGAGVDAVIGPASSSTALATLDQLLDAEVVTCSPTATAIALDDFPDRDLFLRTAPSDTNQALGMATLAEQTGRTSVGLAWVDDAYGRPFARAIDDALRSRPSMETVANVSFPSTGPVDQAIAELVAARPGVVLVAAGTDAGWRFLTALAAAVAADDEFDQPDVIINDGMRLPPAPAVVEALPEEFRASIYGLSPVAFYTDDQLSPFTANAFDCAMLLALAAEEVGPDDHRALAAAVNGLSAGGGTCRTFEQCRAALAAGLNVDYDGLATNFAVQIGPDGDPDRGRYDVFRFDASGLDVTERTITVSR